MADKVYTQTGEEYYPNATYELVDKDGNVIAESKGDNGYVWQSQTQGIPISINKNGDWYTEPYIESDGKKVIAHIPEWFETTNEYNDWLKVYDQIPNLSLTKDTLSKMNTYLKELGGQGAIRYSLKADAANAGITDPELQNQYYDWMMQMGLEGAGKDKAQISGISGDEPKSIAEITRDFKNLSKEDLSSYMTWAYDTLQKGKEGTYTDQNGLLMALFSAKMLNYVDDNYKNFGDKNYGENDEFKGLLEASFWQKYQRGFATASASFTESNVLGLIPRVIYGFKNLAEKGDFDMQIEDAAAESLAKNPMFGANLEGLEASENIGLWGGALTNIAATMLITKKVGNAFGGTKVGAFLQSLNSTPAGAIAADFFINDLPIDFMMAINDVSRYGGDVGAALWNPEEEQPLTGVPYVRLDKLSKGEFPLEGIGPKVPGGLIMNIVGDLIVDCAPYMINVVGSTMSDSLNRMTNGAITRAREKVAIQNFKIQQGFDNIPVVGDAWQKLMNAFMGPENAHFIQEAKKAAIAKGSIDPYVRAQNILTLKNHEGMTEIAPRYAKLDAETKVSESIKYFQDNAKKYGGYGETRVEKFSADAGVKTKNLKAVPDRIPVKVKQGLLDIERLAELKGEMLDEGGVIPNPARNKEIADLEEKISKLPDEIKDFAQRFSDLNKKVELLGVELGISNEDWVNALMLDPKYAMYMTRQSLVPDFDKFATAGGKTPIDAAILNKARKGYYADNYIDPTEALGMKVEALGRAYAWNEMAKALVSFELAQGKVMWGKSGVETAKRLDEVKTEIREKVAYRNEIKYDESIAKVGKDTDSISNAFRKINELMHLPESISLKSIYESTRNPRIEGFLDDFNAGKITFADGVKEKFGLSDSQAASIVNNTYVYKGNKITDVDENAKNTGKKVKKGEEKISSTHMPDNVPENIAMAKEASAPDYNAGVDERGVPYKFEIENGKITSFEEITDFEGLATTINHLGGTYEITTDMASKFGRDNCHALNRTILFYRDNMPNLPIVVKYELNSSDPGVLGWINHPGQREETFHFSVKNGEVVAENFIVNMATDYYLSGKESYLDSTNRRMVNGGHSPKNSFGSENTPIHETGHITMARLALLELNRKIKSGEIKIPTDLSEEGLKSWAKAKMSNEFEQVHKALAEAALEKLGYKFSEANWRDQAKTISSYAASLYPGGGPAYHYETFSEAMVDYAFNGNNASPFALQIVDQIKQLSERYTTAASPAKVMKSNGLDIPKNMMTEKGTFNFPSSAKTDAAKAKWLDKYRQNNPYVKGDTFAEEDYRKANLWDTFFQKEARAMDGKSKTSMPDTLAKKNGEFLEELASTSAKRMVAEIEKASVKGFSEELATMALSRNSDDIAEALDGFIIQRMNQEASSLAERMAGGLTSDNLAKARVTLWTDTSLSSYFATMASNLCPDVDFKTIKANIDRLFDTQAKGFATTEKLPVEIRDLELERKNLYQKLAKENRFTKKRGAEEDAKLTDWTSDTTQVIHYKQAGEDVYVVVDDPVVASILKRPTDTKDHGVFVEGLIRAGNFVSRCYRLGTTGISPLALIRNVLRDPMQATIQGGFNPLSMNLSPEIFYKSLRQYGLDDATIETVTERLHTWAKSSTLTAEMRNKGLTTPSSIGYRGTAEKVGKKIQSFGDSKVIEAAEAPMEAWETMFRNQIAQQSFYKNLKRTGDVNKAMSMAMFDASNSTTNFSHAIGKFRRAVSTVPYLSATINGISSFWRQFNVDPIGMITRIAGGFMVPAMAITTWNLANEERRKRYLNMPEWYRDSHIILMDLENNVIAFPIPEELQQFYGTARRLIEYTQEANQSSIPMIMAQGVFGFLPGDFDGFFSNDGTIDLERGTAQLLSGVLPQAVTTIYEAVWQKDLYTGQDLSGYDGLNKAINTLSNIFGSGVKNWVNDIGMLAGVPKENLIGKGTMDTLARDLFGLGFDDATNQFMNMIGNPSKNEDGKETKATGLFKESEDLKKQIEGLDKKIAVSEGEEKEKYEKEKQEKIEEFTKRVGNLVHNYMNLYSFTGGLEDWQKAKIVSILTLGGAYSSAGSESYQYQSTSEAYLNERALAQQRYLDAGLPGGASRDTILQGNDSIAVQAALNRFYGVPKQAAADFTNALKDTKLKDIRTEFYDAISKIYDIADETNTKPDYDMIEKIQARYLQAVDGVLIPIINQYGINILNNNDFINEVRSYVNGMIPSNDWSQSIRNAKKFLSKKDFPMATVDVKKWLVDRYSSNIRNRNIASDAEVTNQLKSIKEDIDAGRSGAAKGKINSLFTGIQKANYYISSQDMQTLNQLNNMLK